MKTTIAIILSLLPLPAVAQYSGNEATSPTIYMPYTPPTTFQTYGNTTYGSDGTVIQSYGGNQTFITTPDASRPQVVCTTYGTITTCQ